MNIPLVSVVVTTHNSAQYLEACLVSIKNQTYKNIELIIVDDESHDGTRQIADKYADKCFFGIDEERSFKRNYGAKKASGDYLLICDSDMTLNQRVIESAVKLIDRNKLILHLVIPEKSIGLGFWSQCKALERSFYVGVEWMEAPRFFRRNIFLEIGGYDESNTGSEDYDLPQRIEARFGAECRGRIFDEIIQNEMDVSIISQMKKKFYYASSFRKYKESSSNTKKFKMQSSITKRYQIFLSDRGKLFREPAIGAGLIFLKTVEFAAGGAGYLLSFLKKRV